MLLYPLVPLVMSRGDNRIAGIDIGSLLLTSRQSSSATSRGSTSSYTSKTEATQIYIPEVNAILMIGTLLVVLRVQIVERTRRRLWHRRHRYDGHHDDSLPFASVDRAGTGAFSAQDR